MTVLKPRNRMISIRLSEEEYLALKRICTVTGARSVSDLTRDAMRVLLNGSNRDAGGGININDFRTEIRNLNKKVEELAAEVATSRAGSNDE